MKNRAWVSRQGKGRVGTGQDREETIGRGWEDEGRRDGEAKGKGERDEGETKEE